MRQRFPDSEIVTDVGGGLNFQRKGLVSLLERLHRGDKLQIVVAHRDRLARFGFELIQWMAEQNGGQILVLENTDHSPQSRNSPRIFSPSSIPSVVGSTDSAATETKSKRIRLYPTAIQRTTLKLWFDAARWCYNETVAHLRKPGTVANWKNIKTSIIDATPERLKAAPYQVKSIAVRDACRAVSRCKRANAELAQAKARGERLDEPFAEVGFRSRKHPKQGCYIPKKGSNQARCLPHHSRKPPHGRAATRRAPGLPADPAQRAVSPCGNLQGKTAQKRDPSSRRRTGPGYSQPSSPGSRKPTPARSASMTSDASNACATTSTSSSARWRRRRPAESATCGRPQTA